MILDTFFVSLVLDGMTRCLATVWVLKPQHCQKGSPDEKKLKKILTVGAIAIK